MFQYFGDSVSELFDNDLSSVFNCPRGVIRS